jgi:outer membrane protein assembly factor BamB
MRRYDGGSLPGWAKTVCALTGLIVLALGPGAAAATGGGAKLWVARYNGPKNGGDGASGIVTSPDGSKVFVTGWSDGAYGSDYATVAYDASTHVKLWVARYIGLGYGAPTGIAMSSDGSKVFVTGGSTGATSDLDYATVAYDASNGGQLWATRYNGVGNGFDSANSIVGSPDGSKVFVTGQSLVAPGVQDYVTVAYDASTGGQLWLKDYAGTGTGAAGALSIAAIPDGSKVFVTGGSMGTTSGNDYVTLAYDASTGTQLWLKRYNGTGNGDDVATRVVASSDGSKVFVAGESTGTTGNGDYATVAYDASTGHQLWVKRYQGPGQPLPQFSSPVVSAASSPDGSKVFMTCQSLGTTSGEDYATVAYDASTGHQLWVKRYNGPANDFDASLAVATSASEVFVTGTSNGTTSGGDYATVAYDASTGAKLWVARYNGPGNDWDAGTAVVASPDGSKVFVTGSSTGTTGGDTAADIATLAYAA